MQRSHMVKIVPQNPDKVIRNIIMEVILLAAIVLGYFLRFKTIIYLSIIIAIAWLIYIVILSYLKKENKYTLKIRR